MKVLPPIFFFLILSVQSIAQNWIYTNYTPKDGLASLGVQDIIQSSRGYIWIVCNKGITRANGTELKTYNSDHGLPVANFSRIIENNKGELLITSSKGITVYDGIKFDHLLIKGVDEGLIEIYQDKYNQIWVGDAAHRFGKLVGDSIVFDDIFTEQISELVIKILEVNDQLLIVTQKQILRKVKSGYEPIPISNDILIEDVAKESEHQFFIAHHKGLSKYDLDTDELIEVLTGRRVTALSLQNDLLWCGVINGVKVMNPVTLEEVYSSQLPIQLTSEIAKVLVSRDHVIWIGVTQLNGIFKVTNSAFTKYDLTDSNSGFHPSSIIDDGEGGYWIAYFGAGLIHYRADTIIKYTKINGLSSNHLSCLAKDSLNRLWIGTYDKGLNLFDGKVFKSYHPSDGLLENHITSLYCDDQNKIWIGTTKGINSIEWGNIKTYNIIRNGSYGSSNYINVVKSSPQGGVLIGTENGLFINEGEFFEAFTKDSVLSNSDIIDFQLDSRGNYFINTWHSIFIYDPKIKLLNQINKKDGLSADYFDWMLIDKLDQLWLGSERGIDKVILNKDYSVKNVFNIDKNDGYDGGEAFYRSVFLDIDSTFWFGAQSLYHYASDQRLSQSIEPPIHIIDIKVNRQSIKSDTTLSFDIVTPLELNWNQNNIAFYYEAVSMKNHNKILFKYKLIGFDTEWSLPSQSKEITYTNLNPGTYTLQILACNDEGVWNKESATYNLNIIPPVWQRWWFLTSSGIFILLMVYNFFQYRIKKIKEKEKAKRKMVEMELTALRAQMNPHFTFNTMNSIQHFIKKNQPDVAISYISKFATLIRLILDNSTVEMISLERELEAIKMYLEIESLRFEGKFDYEIVIDNQIDLSYDKIPSMVLQPYIENSIWHGLMNKKGKGKITIEIKRKDAFIICSIEDDGVGRRKAQRLKSKYKTNHKSYGMLMTGERLKLLNSEKYEDLNVKVTDLQDSDNNDSGTRVEIFIFS